VRTIDTFFGTRVRWVEGRVGGPGVDSGL
jgi:hypothetical protein